MTKDIIDIFVSSFSDKNIEDLFIHYDSGSYDNLIDEPYVKQSTSIKREALQLYIEYFLRSDSDDDRRTIVSQALNQYKQGKFTFNDFKREIINDQHIEEPLIHILNVGSIPKWWK
jgi:hypothetical protein